MVQSSRRIQTNKSHLFVNETLLSCRLKSESFIFQIPLYKLNPNIHNLLPSADMYRVNVDNTPRYDNANRKKS